MKCPVIMWKIYFAGDGICIFSEMPQNLTVSIFFFFFCSDTDHVFFFRNAPLSNHFWLENGAF